MRAVVAAVQQLLDAQTAEHGRLSTCAPRATVAQLHSKLMAPARILAPKDAQAASVPPAITTRQREALARASMGTITWLTRTMDQQQIMGTTLVQQACELLCALSDVVFVVVSVAPDASGMALQATSSSRSGARGYTASAFMRLDCAEGVLQALTGAAKQLNQHVFQSAASMPPQLVVTACMCCDHMSQLVEGLWWQLQPEVAAQAQELSQSHQLTDWCTRSGLLSELAEGALLVLGMVPNPWLQGGLQGLMDLVLAIVAATGMARRLQIIVVKSSRIYEAAGMDFYSSPLGCVGQQGTGSDGTTPAPFLRLSLLLLAMAQHWRHAAALPPGSVRNSPIGSPRDIAALQRAVQQQVTPSCCSQMLVQHAPSYYVVVNADVLPGGLRMIMTGDMDDLCTVSLDQALIAVGSMCSVWTPAQRPCYAMGPQELQLVLECAELYKAPPTPAGEQQAAAHHWVHVAMALRSCPYAALVEFNTQHGRTLLTLAERNLEAGLPGAAESSGASRSGGSSAAGGAAVTWRQSMEVAAQQFSCISILLSGIPRGMAYAAGDNTYEAIGYPADATWVLLDPSTAPRLLRLMEALVRTPGGGTHNWDVLAALPTHLPEMQLFYSKGTTARATLSAVISITKWLQGRAMALEVLLQHSSEGAAATAATAAAAAHVLKAVPGGVGRELAESVSNPVLMTYLITRAAMRLAAFSLQSLVRPAVLLDPVGFQVTAATAAAPASRSTRVWVVERALLGTQSNIANGEPGADPALAAYKAQVLGNPQQMRFAVQQLQQGLGAQQRAAAARQAAKLAKKQGGDVEALTEQLQALQAGASSSSDAGPPGIADVCNSTLLGQALFGDAHADSSAAGASAARSSSTSSACGVPPVTPGDVTVAANALLVACKAAGALCGVPELLGQALLVTGDWATGEWAAGLAGFVEECRHLAAAVQEVAEWAVLLHPLLVQLLPAEQGQVLVDMQGRLVRGGTGSNRAGNQQQAQGGRGSRELLSGEEVAAVLGALQHVVIPGQPGCSNPRCCCLEGASEAEMKTQVCAGCRGVRYCSAACQKVHWRAGHKEVCKAAQAAAKAAAVGGGGP